MDRLRWVLGALAVVLAVVLVFLLAGRFAPRSQNGLLPTATITPTSASVAAFAGAVFACPHAPTGSVCNTPASLGQHVFVGGEVRTGESGTADVQTHTTVFRLDNGTQVRFRDVSDAVTQVVLAVGRLFASHDPGGRSVVRVQSGQVTIQAIDTRFSVETTLGGIYVAVPPDGGEVTILAGATINMVMVLTAGQEIFISTGTTTTLPAPQPLSPAEQARWDAVGCAWQQIADRLTPVALPPARCAPPTATPTATASPTPRPPPATPVPVVPSETPIPLPTTPPPPPGTPGDTPTPTLTLPPDRTLPAYLGTWLNTDSRAADQPKLTITNKATTLIVQWFTLCASHLCAVSTTNAPFSGPPFTLLSPDKHKLRLTLEKEGTLLRLVDSADDTPYTFRRVAARDYNGIWLNDDPEDPTLRRIVISNSSNKITVDWSSGCFIADCTSTGPFSGEPVVTERFALNFDNVAGTRLQVDDLVQSITYYFHK